MAKLKFYIHPLFILFGVYYFFKGEILVFLIYTLTALLHEIGHSYISHKYGYKLDKICLMPYGAIVKNDDFLMRFSEEVIIAIAGPVLNLIIVVVIIAFWWIAPLSYAYTYLIAEANLSMCLINLLPFAPLDGGRVLGAILKTKLNLKIANKIIKATTVIGILLFLTLTILSIYSVFNLSLAFFALFLIISLFDRSSYSSYVRLYFLVSEKVLKRGVQCKKSGISVNATLKNLYSILSYDTLNEVDLYYKGRVYLTLNQTEIMKLLETGKFNDTIYNNLTLAKKE